jgi:RNA polymerase sigma factor (sigma-70 family)
MAMKIDDYDEWFLSCFPRAVSAACRIACLADAEDAALDAFALAFLRWHRVGLLPWRDGWAVRVSFNNALATARRRPEALSTEPFYESQESDVVLRMALLDALRRLPRRQRETLALRYFLDLPERDVASTLKISVNSVKVHLRRGLDSLRTALGPNFLKGDYDE